MKMSDPIVEEVRKARMEHTMKFNGDLNLICEDLKRIQKESGIKLFDSNPNESRQQYKSSELGSWYPYPDRIRLLVRYCRWCCNGYRYSLEYHHRRPDF
jgi:hypothetical protein